MKMRKKRSKIIEAVHSSARGLRAANAIDQATMDEFDRIAGIRKGLPLVEFDQMADLLGLDRTQLASVLGTSLRTMRRKAQTAARISPATSDRLARIRGIYELASHVFGERDKASRWLTTASRGLGGEIPLQLLDTDIGTDRVQQELRQIEQGMPL
jgi:putative toxin-antitoxin system antitoxin component (TIGR02293 family)